MKLRYASVSRRVGVPVLLVIAAALLAGVADQALAQGNPFGAGRPPAAAPPASDGVLGWMFAKQAEFYRGLSGLVRAAKADGSAVWGLLGLSFLYGIFHAAGPGHGKAVISSYLIANDETWRRGVVLAFASAFVQALVAVLIVGVAAAMLGATARVMGDAVRWIEIASYALIAALGARLVWVKGRAFVAELQARRQPRALGAAASAAEHAHHGHAHHGHVHHDHAHHDHPHGHGHHHAHHLAHGHSHEHGHVHDEHCGHSHGPMPEQLAGPGGWKRGLSAIFAVGLRPCSGAILVLVFALAQGLFWAGIAATFAMGLGTAIAVAAIAVLAVGAKGFASRLASARPGGGMLFVRGVEVAAAGLVLSFGLLLLLGYMSSERLAL